MFFVYFLAISPEMTCKTGQVSRVRPSIRPSGVNIVKTLRLRDCWADA